ncbi:LPXTG cell wall anchor domain-containing protein [uncultured Limosilactobacillus sp.]|uniref:LPXTG cell wall anchor domain-containing protein n=1 Tax=uncultured Limosilactobacillus sp. TaxID=2837629 RepID=UPI00259377F8|nr:LPXTG cell wall anchor domain-containing protein [uncultured Limosilactobacillus sp.]
MTRTVTYSKVVQPTKPTSPTQPTAQPTKPSGQQPTGSSVPTPRPVPAGRPTIPTAAPEPVPVVQPVAKVVTAQPVSLHQGQPTPRAAQRNNTTLPQTGNAEVVSAAALGLMGLPLAGGFAATKKRHE